MSFKNVSGDIFGSRSGDGSAGGEPRIASSIVDNPFAPAYGIASNGPQYSTRLPWYAGSSQPLPDLRATGGGGFIQMLHALNGHSLDLPDQAPNVDLAQWYSGPPQFSTGQSTGSNTPVYNITNNFYNHHYITPSPDVRTPTQSARSLNMQPPWRQAVSMPPTNLSTASTFPSRKDSLARHATRSSPSMVSADAIPKITEALCTLQRSQSVLNATLTVIMEKLFKLEDKDSASNVTEGKVDKDQESEQKSAMPCTFPVGQSDVIPAKRVSFAESTSDVSPNSSNYQPPTAESVPETN